MSLIIAKQLTQTYTSAGRPLTVLADVDLDIAAESFIAIVGPSGSGKTTLLGLLAGLDRPTSGTVALNGQDLSALTDDQRAKFRAQNVGFVFQTFQLIPTLTALENVMVPIELSGMGAASQVQARGLRAAALRLGWGGDDNGSNAEERGLKLLGDVGLGDRVGHYPAQLSGGEQQRVALARAFANQPKVLFADEPTGNLDTETGRRIIDLLVQLNEAAKTTLILVTHDLELAARAHRVIRLSGGRIISDTSSS